MATYVSTVVAIPFGHWPFSDQFQHMTDQNPLLLAKLTFSMGRQSITYKMSYLKKWPTFLTLISTTPILQLLTWILH